ncbi:MAG: NAD-dependent epimerase/dehydratase family protein, partial [Chloroflexota bacterium]
LYQGDVTDKESLRRPMDGVDGVFHLAGWYHLGRRGREQGWRVNVDGTRHVLEVMRDLAIPKGVYTSTLAVNSDTHGQVVDERYRYAGPWLSEYDRTKWVAHYRVAEPMTEAGLPLVIVQPGVVYGPGDPSALGETFRLYLQRRLPVSPPGTAFSWAHVEDVARGHVLAMERGQPGECYFLAGPAHTLQEALEIAERITGIPAPRLHPPQPAIQTLAAVASLVERAVPLPETYSAESLRIMAGVTYLGQNAKAKRELGFQPRPLQEGLRETLLHQMQRLGIELPLGERR